MTEMTQAIYPYWSTLRLRAGERLADQSFRLFVTSCGNSGQGFVYPMSMAHTNVRYGGVSPNGLGVQVEAVGMELFTCPLADNDLGALAATSPYHMSDLRLLLHGVWMWDLVQHTLPGGSLRFPGIPKTTERYPFPAYDEELSPAAIGYASSYMSYDAHIPPHPFSWGVIVRFGAEVSMPLRQDAFLRMTLFLKFDDGVEATST